MFRIAPDKSKPKLPLDVPPSMPEATDVVPEKAGPSDSPSGPDLGVDALAKVDPQKANYQGPESGPFACSNCSFWSNPNACQIVSGPIDPGGICNLFTGLSDQAGPDQGAKSPLEGPPSEIAPEVK